MSGIGLFLIIAGAIPATLIPVLYCRRPWRRSQAGKALLVLSIGLGLLFDLTLINRVFTYPGQTLVALVTVALIAVGLWWLLVAIIRGRQIR